MERLDTILKSYVANGGDTKDKLLGAAFVVVDKDKTLYQGSAGRIDMGPDSPAFTIDTFIWLASMSKIITITSMMKLYEDGHIGDLDSDIRHLVPELNRLHILRGFDDEGRPNLEENTEPVTLRHLLTHTLGMGTDIADPDLTRWSQHIGRTASVFDFSRAGFEVPLRFPPGEGWYYGGAPDWAGVVVETMTKSTLGELVAENVFRPLGMEDTTFRPENQERKARVRDRTAPCTQRGEDGYLTVVPCPVATNPPLDSAGAGLHGTARDHARVLQSLLASLHGEGLLKRETVEEMLRPQLTDTQRGILMGITGMFPDAMIPEFKGLDIPLDHGIGGVINTADVLGKRRKGSMMWQGMCNGHWWIDREAGIAATLFVNVLPQPDGIVNRLYDELERAVYGELLGRT